MGGSKAVAALLSGWQVVVVVSFGWDSWRHNCIRLQNVCTSMSTEHKRMTGLEKKCYSYIEPVCTAVGCTIAVLLSSCSPIRLVTRGRAVCLPPPRHVSSRAQVRSCTRAHPRLGARAVASLELSLGGRLELGNCVYGWQSMVVPCSSVFVGYIVG